MNHLTIQELRRREEFLLMQISAMEAKGLKPSKEIEEELLDVIDALSLKLTK